MTHRLTDPRLPAGWVSAGVLGTLMTTVVGLAAYQFYRDATWTGPLPARYDWPQPIRNLQEALNSAGIDSRQIDVYLVEGRPASQPITVVCRLPDSPQTIAFLQSRLQLTPVTYEGGYKLTGDHAAEIVPPDWWPSASDATDWFANADWVEGREGDLYLVAECRTRGEVFIHYHSNY